MFKRTATLEIKKIYASDESNKYSWRDFVKKANAEMPMETKEFLPKEAYEYDTKNFLYLTARSISSLEKWGPNGNGDAFPWEELKKAYPSFIGRGFYIEHIEDSEEDAKGIILDAEPTEDEFIVCLCAVDKNQYPEICEKIENGELNQVSMSCLSSKCECSKCHNVATSQEELCQHMNQNSPITYLKNKKDENGDLVYEINKDLVFTGLSGVAVPADKDAFIFDVKASKKKKAALNDLMKDYFNAKIKYIKSSKMKELKAELDYLSKETVENRLAIVSETLSCTLKKLLDNEFNQIDLSEFALLLQDLGTCKFILESSIEDMKKESCEEVEQDEEVCESPVVELPIETTVEEVKEEPAFEFTQEAKQKLFAMLKKKEVKSSRKSFWTKLN